MTIELRPYQADMLERVEATFSSGVRSAVAQIPTGGGKTATSAPYIHRRVLRGDNVLFLAHLEALLDDTHERLRATGVHAGLIQSGRPSDASAPVQVASLQTLHRRRGQQGPRAELVILDECFPAGTLIDG